LRRMLAAIDGTTSRSAGVHEPAETGDTATRRPAR
jgi:hypothetical protein